MQFSSFFQENKRRPNFEKPPYFAFGLNPKKYFGKETNPFDKKTHLGKKIVKKIHL